MSRKGTITFSKILTDEEVKQLLKYADEQAKTIAGRRLYLMIDILLNTGLRLSELANLRVQDTPLALGKDVIEVYKGKGQKDRIIPIDERLKKAINKYIKEDRPKTLPRRTLRKDTSKPLFYSHQHRPYLQKTKVKKINKKTKQEEIIVRTRSSVSLYKMIRKLAKNAGIVKNIHPHMFRHTFGTYIASKEKEIGIYTLQHLMGHSSITTTIQYVHFAGSQREGLGKLIDRSVDKTLFEI